MIDDPIRAIISAVGFVLVIGLPSVAAILWRRRARALWSSLIYGAVTSAITYLVWRHLRFEVSQFLNDIVPTDAFWGGMWHCCLDSALARLWTDPREHAVVNSSLLGKECALLARGGDVRHRLRRHRNPSARWLLFFRYTH